MYMALDTSVYIDRCDQLEVGILLVSINRNRVCWGTGNLDIEGDGGIGFARQLCKVVLSRNIFLCVNNMFNADIVMHV